MVEQALRIDGGDIGVVDLQKTEVRWSGTDAILTVAFHLAPFFDEDTPDVFNMLIFGSTGPKLVFDGANNEIRWYPDQNDATNFCSLADSVITMATYSFWGMSCDYSTGKATLRIGGNDDTLTGISGWSSIPATYTLSPQGNIDNFRVDGVFRFEDAAAGTPNFDAWAAATEQHLEYDELVALTYDDDVIGVYTDKTFHVFKFRYVDNLNEAAFIDVGRVILGAYNSPDRNFNMGYEDLIEDLSRIAGEAESGAIYFNEHDLRRGYTLTFELADDDQDDTFETLFKAVKTIKPVVIGVDPADISETIYSRMTGPFRRVKRGPLKDSTWTTNFEELK